MTKIFTFFKYPKNLTDVKPGTLKLMYLQNICTLRGLSFSSEGEGEGPKFTKSRSRLNCDPPITATKFLWPHHRYTLPPKHAKIVLKSVFLNKINTVSVVIL